MAVLGRSHSFMSTLADYVREGLKFLLDLITFCCIGLGYGERHGNYSPDESWLLGERIHLVDHFGPRNH